MQRGLMVIPKDIQAKLGIEKGSYVKVILKGDEIVIKPV